MDPNATLDRIRELVHEQLNGELDEHEVNELAESIGNLDDWLSKKGFLPIAWQ